MWSLETMIVTTSSIKNLEDLDKLMDKIDGLYDESKKFVIQEIISNSIKYSGNVKVILNGITIEVIQKGGDINKLQEAINDVEICIKKKKVEKNFGLNMIRLLGWKIQGLFQEDDNVHIVFQKIAPTI